MIIKENWTNELEVENWNDLSKNPTGGEVSGVGIEIKWQDGPLKFDCDKREYLEKPNGAFVEDIILLAINRLEFFNSSSFSCRENSYAHTHLEEALMWLQKRHEDRVKRKVQGKHLP